MQNYVHDKIKSPSRLLKKHETMDHHLTYRLN
jgi:hypothetical protein